MSNPIDSRYTYTNPATFRQIPPFIVNGTAEKVNGTANKFISLKRNALSIEEGAAPNPSKKMFLSHQQHSCSRNNPMDLVTEEECSSGKGSIEERPAINSWQQEIEIKAARLHFQNKEYALVIKICASLLNEYLTQKSKKEIEELQKKARELKVRAQEEQILDNEQKIKTSGDIQLFVKWCQLYLKNDPNDEPTMRAQAKAENCMRLLYLAGQAYSEGNHEDAISHASTVLKSYTFCKQAEEICHQAQSARESQKVPRKVGRPRGHTTYAKETHEEYKLLFLVQQAHEHYKKGKFTEALKSCNTLLNDASLKQKLTSAQLQSIECIKKKAPRMYEIEIEIKNTDNIELLAKKWQCLEGNDEPTQERLKELEKCIACLNQAERNYEQCDYQDALNNAQKVSLNYPSCSRAKIIYKKAQQWIDIEQLIKKSGDIRPIFNLCQLLLQEYPNDEPTKREQERAENCLKLLDLAEKALDGKPEEAISYANQVLHSYERCQKAKEILMQAQEAPNLGQPPNQTRQAQEECKMHLEKLNLTDLCQLAHNYYQNLQFNQANRLCNQLLELSLPADKVHEINCIKQQVQWMLEIKRLKICDLRQIVEKCRNQIKVYPDNTLAKKQLQVTEKCLELLKQAEEKYRQSDYQQAIFFTSQVLRKYPFCSKAIEIKENAFCNIAKVELDKKNE
jgi:hypothetical protein